MALQSDGRIVAVGLDRYDGNFGIARYLPNGTLDPTFGDRGKASTDFQEGEGDDAAWGVAIDDDGRIVVVGSDDTRLRKNTDVAIARYLGDGRLQDGAKIATDVVPPRPSR